MRKISIPFLVVALSLMVTGMAFAIDVPNVSTWTQSMGIGGGGPGIGDLLLAPLFDVRAIVDPNLPAGGGGEGEGEGGGGETPAALQEDGNGGGPGTTPRIQYTLINIVNTDPLYGVIARIRFREWKRSDEVLDFAIPLSCNDVWVAELSRNGESGGTIIHSPDRWVNASPTATYFPTAVFPTA